MDKASGTTAHFHGIRYRTVPLAGRPLSEKLGIYAPKADQKGLRTKARRGKKVAGGAISGHKGKGRQGKGDHLFRGRDGLQEHPSGGKKLCAQGQNARYHGDRKALYHPYDLRHKQQGASAVHADGGGAQQRGLYKVPCPDDKVQQEEGLFHNGQPPLPQDQKAQRMAGRP